MLNIYPEPTPLLPTHITPRPPFPISPLAIYLVPLSVHHSAIPITTVPLDRRPSRRQRNRRPVPQGVRRGHRAQGRLFRARDEVGACGYCGHDGGDASYPIPGEGYDGKACAVSFVCVMDWIWECRDVVLMKNFFSCSAFVEYVRRLSNA